MSVVRAMLVVAILVELALIVVFLEVRGVRLRYELARRQESVRRTAVENRRLQLDVARALRPDELARRAAGFGLPLRDPQESQRP